MTENNQQTTPIMGSPVYRRIMLKIGGEALGEEGKMGIVPAEAAWIAGIIKRVRNLGVEVAVVVGAGNLWRGSIGVEAGMERATADYMGMLATVLNALALRDALERIGVDTRVQSAIMMREIAEPYIRLRAIRHLEKGRVVILAGGTGNPFFTTDSAAALRGVEINADVLIKATKVDGVYDKDPKTHDDAKRYNRLSFMDALEQRLRVMDATAVTLCMENTLPIVVLNLWEEGALLRAVIGEDVGTTVS
jgi:uridylate kinase